MATYKVPQDVEADDKLIGPFSFRQFIYLIIVAMAIAIAWGLSHLFIGLAIIPLPVILLFGALALPLRKDQPMEIYLAAIVSFYLKPRRRLWDPDGVESVIEVTVPKVVEIQRSKNISQSEAEKRFSYLAGIVDTGGWAIRGVDSPGLQSTTINNDIFMEAQGAEDILDGSNSVAQNFNSMMNKETDRVRQAAIDRMHNPDPIPQPVQQQQYQQPVQNPASAYNFPVEPDPSVSFNPYPSFQQSVIQPINDSAHSTAQPVQTTISVAQPQQQSIQPQPSQQQAPSYGAEEPTITQSTPTSTDTPDPILNSIPEPTPIVSEKPVSADIINLANNSDLSIETIAHEAHRIKEKQENDMTEEVIISLR